MPEGPSILILKELLEPFQGKQVVEASGEADVDMARFARHKILDIKSYGKNLIISFSGFFIRIHLMMYGTYTINKRKDIQPKLRLTCNKLEVNFYTCIVELIEGKPDAYYHWETDVLSDAWDPKKAEKLLKSKKKDKVCDVLLDQEIFTGVGNIIKNEVLFRIKVHPESLVAELPSKKLKELVKETSAFSFDFYNWKKKNQLNRNLKIYSKKECPRCGIPSLNAYIGKGKRLTSYCLNCQVLYVPVPLIQ
jgi:endonuclease-8